MGSVLPTVCTEITELPASMPCERAASCDPHGAARAVSHVQPVQTTRSCCLQTGHPDEEDQREKGVVVFSTDSRPVKRRQAQIDRHFERMSQQQVCMHADCKDVSSMGTLHEAATLIHSTT